MKNFCWIALISVLILSCAGHDEHTLTFDTASADKMVKLSNDEGSPTCAVHLKVAYATEESGQKAKAVNAAIQKALLDMKDLTMKQAVDSFASMYINNYVKSLLPLYNQDRADTAKWKWYQYHYVVTTETYNTGKDRLAYIATIDYSEGGEHGMNLRRVINFNTSTGHEIKLTDIFVQGSERYLTDILQLALMEKTGAQSIEQLRRRGFLGDIEIKPKNFLLNGSTITFIFNPEEIAVYEVGATELTIPLSKLRKLLKQEYQ